jgi:hypothetical protein
MFEANLSEQDFFALFAPSHQVGELEALLDQLQGVIPLPDSSEVTEAYDILPPPDRALERQGEVERQIWAHRVQRREPEILGIKTLENQ